MKYSMQKVALAGVAVTAVFTLFMAAQLRSAPQALTNGDFRNAQTAELRDAQGKVLLRGTFAPVDSGDDQEIERLAKLESVDNAAGMSGEAEVEYRKDEPNVQEIEFQVSGVPSASELTLVLDGKPVLKAKSDGKGRAEAEVNVNVTGQ